MRSRPIPPEQKYDAGGHLSDTDPILCASRSHKRLILHAVRMSQVRIGLSFFLLVYALYPSYLMSVVVDVCGKH